MTHEQFIEEIAQYVIKYAPQFNIKVVSPIIAQACLESGYGTGIYNDNRNKVRNPITGEWRHNYFGMKYRPNRVTCNKGYFNASGSEQKADGHYEPIETDWYSFDSMEMGVLGYFQFTNCSIYSSIHGVTDPYQYLVNIKACGYATSQKYVENVWNTLQSNNLTRFDKEVATSSKPAINTKFMVAIDAGHGSNTAGKRTPDGYREHWINVSCAAYCEEALKRCGLNALRVAWNDCNAIDDEDLALSKRQNLIKQNKCNVSVSFHANAYGSGWNDAQGVETLISDKYPGDSKNLATKVQNHLIEGTKQKNRGVKTQSLAMCNCNAMGVKAAILVEIGFMTNKVEAELMKTDAFCKEQAEEVAHGICDYLGVAYRTGSASTVVTPSEKPKEEPKEESKETTAGYLVKINTASLNVRKGPGMGYAAVTSVKRGQVYTIVEEQNGWGKLKSGAGWIKLSYTIKV